MLYPHHLRFSPILISVIPRQVSHGFSQYWKLYSTSTAATSEAPAPHTQDHIPKERLTTPGPKLRLIRSRKSYYPTGRQAQLKKSATGFRPLRLIRKRIFRSSNHYVGRFRRSLTLKFLDKKHAVDHPHPSPAFKRWALPSTQNQEHIAPPPSPPEPPGELKTNTAHCPAQPSVRKLNDFQGIFTKFGADPIDASKPSFTIRKYDTAPTDVSKPPLTIKKPSIRRHDIRAVFRQYGPAPTDASEQPLTIKKPSIRKHYIRVLFRKSNADPTYDSKLPLTIRRLIDHRGGLSTVPKYSTPIASEQQITPSASISELSLPIRKYPVRLPSRKDGSLVLRVISKENARRALDREKRYFSEEEG